MDKEPVENQSPVDSLNISYEDNVDIDEACSNNDEERYDDPVSTTDLRKNLVLNFDNAYDKAKDSIEIEKGKKKSKLNKKKPERITRSQSRPPKAPVTRSKTTSKRTHDVVRNSETNDHLKPLLDVYLRVRPPVAPGDSNPNAEFNTVEIIPANECSNEFKSIRTYPPVTSNAAKSYRSGSKRNISSQNPKSTFSNDIASGISDSNFNNDQFATGVKEFDFNKVFKPETSQVEIYENVAAPLVEGLFPKALAKQNIDVSDSKHKIHESSPLRKRSKGVDGNVINASTEESGRYGRSALLFAYGITNAGKTHTMVGDMINKKRGKSNDTKSLKAEAGILPRALEHMLAKIDMATKIDSDNVYLMHMSYLEIYNENIFDLLPPEKRQQQSGYDSSSSVASSSRVTRSKAGGALRLREDCNGHIFVKGLSKHPISSVAQGIKLANIASEKRHTSSNNINNDSSRSHCVCQLELTIIPKNSPSVENEIESERTIYNSTNMWIVDLAGIERSKRTGMVYRSTRQKEAAVINASLMNLMRCLQTMSTNQLNDSTSSSEVVPFRESKLTHLFMNHLTGASSSQTSMIVNINPAAADYDETQHVLSYAAVARTVKISAKDYIEKFKAIAGLSPEEIKPKGLNDENEGVVKESSKSPKNKVAKIVKNLSPRALLKKKRERKAAARVKKNELQVTRNAIVNGSSKTEIKATANAQRRKVETEEMKKNNRKEIDRLRLALQEMQEENSSLKEKLVQAKEEQFRRDSELRMEVVQEMENEIREIRDHYESLERKNKVVANPTPMKTIKTLQTERQEQFIQELMEKHDECEDEMVRMSERHAKEIEKIHQLHDEILKSKDKKIIELQQLYHNAAKTDNDKIQKLKEELNKTTCDYNQIRKEHENLLAFVENEAMDGDGGLVDSDGETHESDKENTENKSRSKSGFRLARNRYSEVACADVPLGKRITRSSKNK